MLVRSPSIPVAEFEAGTGWSLKPEGACRGDVCVPLGTAGPVDGRLDVASVAEKLGMAFVHHDDSLAALGPATVSGRALTTVEAPELVLDDFDGNEFRLSSLRGEKVVLVAWAPY
jgi:hypothetical protein